MDRWCKDGLQGWLTQDVNRVRVLQRMTTGLLSPRTNFWIYPKESGPVYVPKRTVRSVPFLLEVCGPNHVSVAWHQRVPSTSVTESVKTHYFEKNINGRIGSVEIKDQGKRRPSLPEELLQRGVRLSLRREKPRTGKRKRGGGVLGIWRPRKTRENYPHSVGLAV